MILSSHELSLLSVAVPYFQEVGGQTTRDELKRSLHCGSDTAQRILTYLMETEAAKVADRLQKLPKTAEAKATVQFALGDTGGTLVSHVLRTNIRLQRNLGKKKHEATAFLESAKVEAREAIEELKAEANLKVKHEKVSTPKVDTGLLLGVGLFDAHFGKLCYSGETNDSPYDLQIAQQMFLRALDILIERAKGFRYERVLFPVGQDFLHANGMDNKTANGTLLDCDSRYQKVYTAARRTLTEAVERLRRVAPTTLLTIPGNHDRSVWSLIDSLECWFKDCPDVTIDNTPPLRKAFAWGKCGFLITHGDLGKKKDYPLVFATEFPEIFAKSKWREIWCGHVHHSMLEEVHGVHIRTLSSLTPPDLYHFENMFTGNLRKAEAFVFSKTEGLIATYTYCDDLQPTQFKTERKLV